ncbi:nuclear transport factor 2 family protein [Oleomonas cavernae]|uniref:Nuclear transport factor 2 family protein n=1 Tax=Oleomonas cavernae TaxID=2320859 RepID=A0A418WHD9_9PROT|nr:nuclear transport factor 2 family protein [Oleomonas cavernae]RJF89444.1 nuclear transport factor 2 family protein [Oleomonas cavernae]
MALRLEDMELIKQLKYKYCRAIDTCDLDLLASLLTPDAEVDYQGGIYRFHYVGRDNVLTAIKEAFSPQLVSSHTVHHPIIEVHDDDTADGHWTLIDWTLSLAFNNTVVEGSSFYVDKYVKQNGKWLIKKATYTRLFERVHQIADSNLTAHVLGAKAAAE